VAVIGTGASAVQVVPAIQPRVAKLTLFQRTPPWVAPHMDHEVSPRMREVYRRLPVLQRLSRGFIYSLIELALAPGMTRDTRLLKVSEWIVRRKLRREVPDPELRRRLTPTFQFGCKRIVFSSLWYPALQQQNVDLVTSGIREVREHSIVDRDGAEHEIDTLVLATGFTPAELPIAERVHGRDGRSLAETWDGSPQAYLGTTVTGFPNLLFFYGPNLNLGHTSIVYMLESQLAYAMDALRTMRSLGAAEFDVRPEVQAAYNDEIQERLAGTVWSTGCSSWYIDRNGRNSIMWPGYTFEYRRRTRAFDAEAYRLAPASAAAATASAASAAPAA
jgi:cation diffusion facilitator CzcD-associated flavoprotein CzcO